jgi:hypothetical protein
MCYEDSGALQRCIVNAIEWMLQIVSTNSRLIGMARPTLTEVFLNKGVR